MLTKMLVIATLALGACAQDVSVAPGDGGADGGGGGGGGGGGTDPLNVAKSGSRVKMKVLTAGDGAKALQGWFDSQRNEDCVWQAASDGMTRCLPAVVAWGGTYYAESTCTTPAGYYWAGCTPPAYISVNASTACPTGTTGATIYQRGAALTTVYVKSGANCTATTSAYPAWAVGAVVAPTSFQAATIATE